MTMTTEEREAVEYLRRTEFSRGYHVTERYLRMAIHIIDRLTTPAPPATPGGDTDALVEEAQWVASYTSYPDETKVMPQSLSHRRVSECWREAKPLLRRLADALAEAKQDTARWREYAEHQEWCRYCGEDGVDQCSDGKPLKDAARRGAQEGGT
jgi:hypothetical protein